ncbi:MAG: hypothetical protein WDN26_11310 [Chitinophagaceae bacterium]
MKLRKEILAEHSKSQKDKIVNWVGNSQERFDELFNLFLKDEYRVTQRAAYPLSYCIIKYPGLLKKHWGKLIKNLSKKDLHNAIKRNTVRMLQDIAIPEKYHGEIMNICFEYIQSPEEAVAVKAFSLTVLDNLSKIYPDIKPELKTIIEDRWNYETAAFRSRAKKILKKISVPS